MFPPSHMVAGSGHHGVPAVGHGHPHAPYHAPAPYMVAGSGHHGMPAHQAYAHPVYAPGFQQPAQYHGSHQYNPLSSGMAYAPGCCLPSTCSSLCSGISVIMAIALIVLAAVAFVSPILLGVGVTIIILTFTGAACCRLYPCHLRYQP